jgi:hypothetical protein
VLISQRFDRRSKDYRAFEIYSCFVSTYHVNRRTMVVDEVYTCARVGVDVPRIRCYVTNWCAVCAVDEVDWTWDGAQLWEVGYYVVTNLDLNSDGRLSNR